MMAAAAGSSPPWRKRLASRHNLHSMQHTTDAPGPITILSQQVLGRKRGGPDRKALPIQLTALDSAYMSRLYVAIAFAYDEPIDPERLSATLEETLIEYYPATGRIYEAGEGLLQLSDFGAGIPFLRATCDANAVPIKDLFQGIQDPRWLVGLRYLPTELVGEDAPLLTVQLTSFAGGGCTVGICFHHALSDAEGVFQLISHWSALYRGETPSVTPIHTRLRVLRPSAGGNDVPENYICLPMVLPPTVPDFDPERVSKVFHFTREFLDRMKRESNSYSTNDALAAFLWQKMTEARQVPRDQGPMSYCYSIGLRGRIKDPAIPEKGYFGNAVVIGRTTVPTAGALLDMSLPELCKKLRAQTNEQTHPEVLQDVVQQLQELDPRRTLAKCNTEGNDMFISSWARFPMIECSAFGARPSYASSLPANSGAWLFPNVVLPMPAADGGLEVLIGLRAEHMRALTTLLAEHATGRELQGA